MYSNISINIISFNVPYPPNYGGTIDVFYKIKTLYELGVKIHLHCFLYDRPQALELENYCVSVNYYKRKTGFKSNLSLTPYIVKSRQSEELVNNLLQNNYPIMFEGLHSCSLLSDIRIRGRIKLYRESNIEHEYYSHLAKSTKKISDKLFYYIESFKLRLFQKKLKYADCLLVVSKKDEEYLKKRFRPNLVLYLPSFHGNQNVVSKKGKGNYILYHGNLSVEENIVAANYLINNIFSKISHQVIIAGLKPDKSIANNIAKYDNIKLIANPDDKEMRELVENAHINILYTHQATGLKLKLLNVLYQGRFVLVNSKMCVGTDLSDLCVISDKADEMIANINILFENDFTEKDIAKRSTKLDEMFNDERNGLKIIERLQPYSPPSNK
ncbi:glycosyltransferase family 1 protein [Bacteroidales bacterium OttesenSCG-928-K03]|nr:glycosyltransferase family 1 protein [Odoribacter sp. OttesenSCG-928-L07]MDL2240475.1 glycosyltransferase family 1 protein [Bacteroidales bacterium OttesenSCG-928-K22]MDL2242287.1 glycosyltransferase family 1 protein [Bacteroidales bacterium OttesenSCG-928-K03]